LIDKCDSVTGEFSLCYDDVFILLVILLLFLVEGAGEKVGISWPRVKLISSCAMNMVDTPPVMFADLTPKFLTVYLNCINLKPNLVGKKEKELKVLVRASPPQWFMMYDLQNDCNICMFSVTY